MMDKEKMETFAAFARKAKEKIEERKKVRKAVMHVGDIGFDITLRGLSDQEIDECAKYSEDDFINDKYTVYFASSTLQELARYMKENGQIRNELEVMDMFSKSDRKALAHKVLELSGIYDNTTVNEVDELKNSTGETAGHTCTGMPYPAEGTPEK